MVLALLLTNKQKHFNKQDAIIKWNTNVDLCFLLFTSERQIFTAKKKWIPGQEHVLDIVQTEIKTDRRTDRLYFQILCRVIKRHIKKRNQPYYGIAYCRESKSKYEYNLWQLKFLYLIKLTFASISPIPEISDLPLNNHARHAKTAQSRQSHQQKH